MPLTRPARFSLRHHAAQFWGQALSKLLVFNMTQYKKLLWMDSDTLVFKNLDHLFLKPMLTAAFTYAWCVLRAGMWAQAPPWRGVRRGSCTVR